MTDSSHGRFTDSEGNEYQTMVTTEDGGNVRFTFQRDGFAVDFTSVRHGFDTLYFDMDGVCVGEYGGDSEALKTHFEALVWNHHNSENPSAQADTKEMLNGDILTITDLAEE